MSSTNGLLAYIKGSDYQSRLVWRDRQGNALGNLGEPTGTIGGVALSRDGKRVAASIFGRSGIEDIWIYDTTRGVSARLTFEPRSNRTPVWSPEGATLYFSSNRNGRMDLFRKASDDVGAGQLLFADSEEKRTESVSPDGQWLLYNHRLKDLWMLPLSQAQRKPQPQVFLQTPFYITRSQFSPDGRWVAYTSNESGQNRVYAVPFPAPVTKSSVSAGGGQWAQWRQDGKEIFYISPEGQLMAAEIGVIGGRLEVGRVQKLFDGVITNRDRTYDVSSDGQRFLVVSDDVSSSRSLTLLQNWTALLRK